jgi:hypothetical protein
MGKTIEQLMEGETGIFVFSGHMVMITFPRHLLELQRQLACRNWNLEQRFEEKFEDNVREVL